MSCWNGFGLGVHETLLVLRNTSSGSSRQHDASLQRGNCEPWTLIRLCTQPLAPRNRLSRAAMLMDGLRVALHGERL